MLTTRKGRLSPRETQTFFFMYCPECGIALYKRQVFEREDHILVCDRCFMSKPFGEMYCGDCGLLITKKGREIHIDSNGTPLCSDCLWAAIEIELDSDMVA